jgi:hypothetical protein
MQQQPPQHRVHRPDPHVDAVRQWHYQYLVAVQSPFVVVVVVAVVWRWAWTPHETRVVENLVSVPENHLIAPPLVEAHVVSLVHRMKKPKQMMKTLMRVDVVSLDVVAEDEAAY